MEYHDSKKYLENDYRLGKVLGRGQFGVIKLATCLKTGKEVAVKIISKDDLKKTLKNDAKEKLLREINIMKICDHPHIVKYIDFYTDDSQYYIVMEYVKCGDLFEIILRAKNFSISDVRKVFCQMISAMEYCHGNLIAHRDIKLENILVADKKEILVKIADFGLSNYIKTDALHNTACGSLEYAAPEILMKSTYNPIRSDIWSMGVVLYTMATQCFPWGGSLIDIRNRIINCDYDKNHISHLDNDLKDLLSKIFVPAENRITINQMKMHPWLVKYTIPSFLRQREPVGEIILLLVDKVISLGFDQNEVLTSLYSNANTQETAIYHLLKEKLYGPKTHTSLADTNKTFSKSETILNLKSFRLVKITERKIKSCENVFE